MSNRPDWCPADVWDDTRHVLSDGFTSPIPSYEMAARVARAIITERERCARVAAQFIDGRLYRPKFPACSYHAGELADAIRDPQA